MIAQTTETPQIQGLSPTLQFVLTVLTMLLPLIFAIFKAWQNGKTLNSVIIGTEAGASGAVQVAKDLLSKASRGETITEADLKQIESRFKTGIQQTAIIDGVEEVLAPRVQKVTSMLDPLELKKRLERNGGGAA